MAKDIKLFYISFVIWISKLFVVFYSPASPVIKRMVMDLVLETWNRRLPSRELLKSFVEIVKSLMCVKSARALVECVLNENVPRILGYNAA